MYTLDGYIAGANLGHWISQYGNKGREHWDSYIIASDFENVARLGFDHLRLPVDYFIFENDSAPGKYDESTLHYIDFALECCKKNGLNLILDLHHAPGFFFGNNSADNNLLTNAAQQERYINIWTFFAERYASEGDNLIFELLNELVWKDSEPWNSLWQRTVAAINAVSLKRRIIVGGNDWNSVTQLKNLYVTNSDRVIYTFHTYEPMIFSHQKAGWIDYIHKYNKNVEYPVNLELHKSFYGDELPDNIKNFKMLGREYMETVLAPAAEFIEKNKRPLYCGEYGVISYADIPSSVRWYNDVADIMLSLGIGRAVWSYRGFANVTGDNREVISNDLIKAVTRKK